MFLFRFLRRLAKALVYLIVIIVLIPVAGLAYGFLSADAVETKPLAGPTDDPPPAELTAKVKAEIPDYQSPAEATFLSYPEWAINHAARDYAGFVKDHQPSAFPYWSYVGRYWQDCVTMMRASAEHPVSLGSQAVLVAMGTAYTVENAIQWAYENTVGRITQATANGRTAADKYQAKVAAEYAAFLDEAPWYQFPYAEKRAGLMALTRAPGDDPVRTTERRWAYGLAYAIKQGCADLIGHDPPTSSDPASPALHVWVKGPIGEAVRDETDALLERDLGSQGSIFVTRRGQIFTDMLPRLIEQGVSFVEIGGNDEIMITVLSTNAVAAPEGSRTLFQYQLPVDDTERRTGLVVAVRKLDTVMPALLHGGARLERVYD
jgi:hypothetical protein